MIVKLFSCMLEGNQLKKAPLTQDLKHRLFSTEPVFQLQFPQLQLFQISPSWGFIKHINEICSSFINKMYVYKWLQKYLETLPFLVRKFLFNTLRVSGLEVHQSRLGDLMSRKGKIVFKAQPQNTRDSITSREHNSCFTIVWFSYK